MRLSDFEALVRRLAGDVPVDFLEGVVAVEVSPGTIPHPTRAEVYTMGECVPVSWDSGGAAEGVQSRVVLYHGSFTALARLDPAFDWRREAWDTLTHELRHHLEWRARAPDLEAYDRAAEDNFARQDGAAFDPLFFLDGDRPDAGVYRVEDDFFLDRPAGAVPSPLRFTWHGREYLVVPPSATRLPAFLTVEGVEEPPPGELVLVLRRRRGLLDLLRRPTPFQATVAAVPA